MSSFVRYGRLGSKGGVSSLALQLFGSGAAGDMWDASQADTLYQAINAELLPATANNDPVGVWLGIGQWAGRSFEQVMAGQADLGAGYYDTANWADNNSTLTELNSVLTLTTTVGLNVYSQYDVTTVVGDIVIFTAEIFAPSSNTITTAGRIAALAFLTPFVVVSSEDTWEEKTLIVKATATTTKFFLECANGGQWSAIGDEARFRNIVIRKIPGTHFPQTTAGSRPLHKTALGKHWAQGDGVADTAKTMEFVADGDILLTAAVNEATAGTLVELRNTVTATERIAITENQVEVRGDNGQADQTIAITLSGDHVVSVVATESDRKVEAFVDGVSAGSVTLTGTAWFDTVSTNKTISILATNAGADFSDGRVYRMACPIGPGVAAQRLVTETWANEAIT